MAIILRKSDSGYQVISSRYDSYSERKRETVLGEVISIDSDRHKVSFFRSYSIDSGRNEYDLIGVCCSQGQKSMVEQIYQLAVRQAREIASKFREEFDEASSTRSPRT